MDRGGGVPYLMPTADRTKVHVDRKGVCVCVCVGGGGGGGVEGGDTGRGLFKLNVTLFFEAHLQQTVRSRVESVVYFHAIKPRISVMSIRNVCFLYFRIVYTHKIVWHAETEPIYTYSHWQLIPCSHVHLH